MTKRGWPKKRTLPISFSLPLQGRQIYRQYSYGCLDNLLPDNEAIRRHLAERTGAEGDDAYNLLAAVGRDCIGALQFLPAGAKQGIAGQIKSKRLTNKAIENMKSQAARQLGVTADDEFRISIAGMQEKTALLRWKGAWCKPLGSTATTYILKPQIGRLPNGIDLSKSVENEHFCMTFLKNLGLPVAETKIQDFGKTRVLVIKRFDRHLTKDKRLLRLPQEDCCQALSVLPTKKYENEGGPGMRRILRFLRGSDDPEHDQKLFLQAQIIFWLLGATDGHAKNFSIFLGWGDVSA